MRSVVNYAYILYVPSGKNVVLAGSYIINEHEQPQGTQHLASSGKVKPDWIQSHVAFIILATREIQARTRKQSASLHLLFLLEWISLSKILPSWQGSTPQAYLISLLNALSSWSFGLLSHLLRCHVHYQGSPLADHSTLVNWQISMLSHFKVKIVFFSLTLGSRWPNWASLLAMRKRVREREEECEQLLLGVSSAEVI